MDEEAEMAKIIRVIVAPKDTSAREFTIYNLELGDLTAPGLGEFVQKLRNPETEVVLEQMPKGKFIEVMYHNGVVDPAQEPIQIAAREFGVEIEAAKISHRYYGKAIKNVFINKLVHMWFHDEPELETLKPRGSQKGMQVFNLLSRDDGQLTKLSEDLNLQLSLEQIKKLAEIQKRLELPVVTDVFLQTFAARWSDHCFHTKWKALGLFKVLQRATEKIRNSNLVSAFVDNAGGWKFFGRLVAVLKLETHNSPSQKEPYGGQLTKIGGVLRDILGFALGALAIGNLEMTVVGEFIHRRFPFLKKAVLPAKTIARETIRAIADYGNPMGVPMLLARMQSHPNFGAKTFALGGSVGITKRKYATKGCPRPGDLVVIAGGRTGNDGIQGATTSSGELTEHTDTGDASHVQIGHPYTEQKMMRAVEELQRKDCCSVINDFGAAGIPSAVFEPGEDCGPNGGVTVNLALVKTKCEGLAFWQIALSESQERMMFGIKPEKRKIARWIFAKYQLEYTVVGIFTGNGRAVMFHDPEVNEFTADMEPSQGVCFDVPYSYFKECPLPKLEVVEPLVRTEEAVFPAINYVNVDYMADKVVGHFDVCDQSAATTQYDNTVQGRTYQGPLYGRNYNIASSLAVLKPVYGKPWALTLSQSFSPWQFEVDPVQAAINAMMDVVVTQVAAGVRRHDICLADNFYTPNLDPCAYWHLSRQVEAIAGLSIELGTPFITGKDSSSGSSTTGGLVNVLPSVCITAMGKQVNAHRLNLHRWSSPGNWVFLISPRIVENLGGSVLSSALGITGTMLEGPSISRARTYVDKLQRLAQSNLVKSAVPVSRGGIILRLFEGIEASGFGFETNLCPELFPEHMGSVLVEVAASDVSKLQSYANGTEILAVGKIIPEDLLVVQGLSLQLQRMREGWRTKFQREVYNETA